MNRQVFCEVAAQVIPVLFIALLIEMRFFGEGDEESPGAELGLLAIIVLAAVAEFTAITALSEERQLSDFEKSIVGAAIFLLFFPIAYRAGRPRVEAIGKALPWTRWFNIVMPIVVVAVAFAVTIFNLSLVAILTVGAFVFFIVASGLSVFESDLRRIKRHKQEKERDG